MPLPPVFGDQVEGAGQDLRLDLVLQIGFPPGLQRGAPVLAKRLELKGQKGVNIQPPGQIILMEPGVGAPVSRSIDIAELAHKFPPEAVAVTRDQGLVEIKDGQFHYYAAPRWQNHQSIANAPLPAIALLPPSDGRVCVARAIVAEL